MMTQGLSTQTNVLNDRMVSSHIPISSLLKKTLFLALPFIAIFELVIMGYYKQQVTTVEESALRINEYANHDLCLTLQQILRNIKGDTQLLASNPLLPRVLLNPWGSDAQLLAEQWIAFSSQKRIYDQLRLVDFRGQEILRVNLTATGADTVPHVQLQDKSKRYYFRDIMTLSPGEIYLSPLDLNIENKTIEQPIKPMIRIGTPIRNEKGTIVGALILNYLAVNIMADIDTHGMLTDSQHMFLNSDGYYLRGLAREKEWLFMYPERNQSRGNFSFDYPDVWRNINRVKHDQLSTEWGVFSYQWISSDEEGISPSSFTRRFVIVSMISTEQLMAMKAPYRKAAWGASLLALPTIVLFAAFVSHFRLRELNAFERLLNIEANQRLILETVGEGIIGIDANGHLTFANSRAQDLTGYTQSEMLGRPLHYLIHACNKKRSQHLVDACPLQQSLFQGKSRREDSDIFIRKNCDGFPVEYISNPIIKDGKLQGGVVSFFDITARKRAEQRVEYLALYDPLTDLPNKRLFIDRLSQQLAAARNNHLTSALFYIDIDRFKQINDAMGHEYGDQILIEIAKRLKYITQDGDTVAHIGSDEFVLLRANDSINAEHMAHNAQLSADEIMLILKQPFFLEHNSVRLTSSIGIAIFPLDNEDASAILAQADTAVASAKHAGRNTSRFFKAEMEQTTKKWLLIHNRMLEALAHEAFTLVYQPKVEQNGKLIGVEALLRWTDDELGTVSPTVFIPIAEQSGLILQISDFVLTRACKQIRCWCDAGLTHTFGRVAINMSPNQLNNKDFVDYVLGLIHQAGIETKTIELEITERTLLDNTADTYNKLLTLREQGVRLSVDDFGTGYSSLAYLQQLPLNWLKIDRAFITDVDKNNDRQNIVEAIILLAKGLAIEVIAEGVETEEELNYLLKAGCHEFQGYYFYQPMTPEELTKLLRNTETDQDTLP